MEFINNTILDRYKGLIIDLCGVLHNGKELFLYTNQAISNFREAGKTIISLSNSPRPSPVAKANLVEMGFMLSQDDIIITSGDLVRAQLSDPTDNLFKNLGKKFYFIGEEQNKDLLSNLAIKFDQIYDIAQADFLLLSAFMTSEQQIAGGINIYDNLYQTAIAKGLPLICANPDKFAPHGHSANYPSGVFAKRYEELGGKAYYYGKPHANAYEKILAIFKKAKIEQSEILAIGDSMETDILGANNLSIDSVLVLSGTNKANEVSSFPFAPTYMVDNIGCLE